MTDVTADLNPHNLQRIMLRSRFEDKDAAKSVLGARWNKTERAWTYPATVETCHGLREAFGPRLRVGKALSEFYVAAAADRQEQVDLTSADDAQLKHLPSRAPKLAATLRPDQRVGVLFGARGYQGKAIIADEPGLGKTLISIGAVIERHAEGSFLVACPRISARTVWEHEINRWTGDDDAVFVVIGSRAEKETAIEAYQRSRSPRRWLVTNIETLRAVVTTEVDDYGKRRKVTGFEYPALFEEDWSSIIVDESHRAFGSLTVRQGNLAGLGLMKLTEPDRHQLTLSGTPFGDGGRVQGMFGTLRWLWPKDHTSYWRWVGQHFEVTETQYGPGVRDVNRQVGALKRGERDLLESLGPRIIRRRKAEVLPWLAAKEYRTVMCEMTPKQERQYNRLISDATLADDNCEDFVNGVLAERVRYRQIANGFMRVSKTEDGDTSRFDVKDSGKAQELFQLMDERGIFEGQKFKMVVASNFNDFLYSISNHLEAKGVRHYVITGDVSMKVRDKVIADYQTGDEVSIILLNSKTGGVAINLDTADELHRMDLSDDPSENEQLENRVHRASRDHKVTIFDYVTQGTIDVKVRSATDQKAFRQHLVLDGRRGLDWLRGVDASS